jgi:hypothetical protein
VRHARRESLRVGVADSGLDLAVLRQAVRKDFAARQRAQFQAVAGLQPPRSEYTRPTAPWLRPQTVRAVRRAAEDLRLDRRDCRHEPSLEDDGYPVGLALDNLAEYLERCYIESRIEVCASEVEERTRTTRIQVEGEEMTLASLRVATATEPDAERRERLENRLNESLGALVPLQHRLLERTAGAVAELGYSSIHEYVSSLHHVSVEEVRDSVGRFLEQTDPTYESWLDGRADALMGSRLHDLRACHGTFLVQFRELAKYLPARDHLTLARAVLENAGLANASLQGVEFDLTERPTKSPRAACFVPDPPSQIQISVRSRDGLRPFLALLHELAHACHFASMTPRLPFELRVLSGTDALTEAIAWLAQFLVHDWRVLGHLSIDVSHPARVGDLALIRKFAARILTDLDITAGAPNAGDRYVDYMNRALGTKHDSRSAFLEFSPILEPLAYWRAWVSQASLQEGLDFSYGCSWRTNGNASSHFRQLFAAGLSIAPESLGRPQRGPLSFVAPHETVGGRS